MTIQKICIRCSKIIEMGAGSYCPLLDSRPFFIDEKRAYRSRREVYARKPIATEIWASTPP